MVGFPDRRLKASWNALESASRRRLLKHFTGLGGALVGVCGFDLPRAWADSEKNAAAPSDGRPIAIDRATFFSFSLSARVALACGERGLIARWDNSKPHWVTQRISASKNLTAIAAHTEGLAVTVGHSGAICVSRDFGQNWVEIAESERQKINPNREALLTVAIDRNRNIVVAGAFGVMAVSSDLGKSWAPLKPFAADFDLHIYHLAQDDSSQSWLMMGESGTIGETSRINSWRKLQSPYQGSLFGGLFTPMGARIIFGMRGQIYRQANSSAKWQLLEVPTTVAWMAGRVIRDGRIVLVGDQGMIAFSQDDGRRFEVKRAWNQSISDVIELENRQIWLAGKSGLQAFDSHFQPISAKEGIRSS